MALKSKSQGRPVRSGRRVRHVLLALGWYYPLMHQGVARYARDHGWHVTADFDDPVPKNWEGDGVLTLLGARQDIWRSVRRLGVPVVDLAESRPQIAVPRVTMDNGAIGQMAARYFVDRGYRHYAFVDRWDLGVARRRRRHFEETLREAGYSCHVLTWNKERGGRDDTRAERHRWLVDHLTKLPKPLAVFAMRDNEGAEVIEACLAADIPVPEQVAVLGVDNTETVCECLSVPLSSIDDNLETVGFEAASLLDRLMRGRRAPAKPLYIPPIGIVERRSTDMLAVEHPGVLTALQFIQANFHRPIGVPDIVECVGMSRSGLEKAFRESYVRTPNEELRRVRIERAKQMLLETDEKITTVARATGFQTAHNLCRAFGQRVGMTPKTYRQRQRAG